MALIECCECGHKVSEYAEFCLNCGCPVSIIKKLSLKENQTIINGVTFDFTDIKKMIENGEDVCSEIEKKCNVSTYVSLIIKGIIRDNNNEIPPNLDEELEKIRSANGSRVAAADAKKIHCPYCKSDNVKKISMAGRAVFASTFGLASKKVGKQWHCNKCGSDF